MRLELHEGIEELKAADADVVLIDPQYAPAVIAKSETTGMVEQIALAAKDENVDLFRRFAVMRDWHEVDHLGFDCFRVAGPVAHERLGLRLLGQASRRGDRGSRDPPDDLGCGAFRALNYFAVECRAGKIVCSAAAAWALL